MSIPRAAEDGWTKEMAKWETRPVVVNGTFIDPLPRERGGRRDHPFLEYPKMLYKAESADGGPRICDFIEAKDADDEMVLVGRGWAPSQPAALGLVEFNQRELARLAANRTYNDRWMSQNAKDEANAYDETQADHVAEIPATPIKRRGPGKKTLAATGEG